MRAFTALLLLAGLSLLAGCDRTKKIAPSTTQWELPATATYDLFIRHTDGVRSEDRAEYKSKAVVEVTQKEAQLAVWNYTLEPFELDAEQDPDQWLDAIYQYVYFPEGEVEISFDAATGRPADVANAEAVQQMMVARLANYRQMIASTFAEKGVPGYAARAWNELIDGQFAKWEANLSEVENLKSRLLMDPHVFYAAFGDTIRLQENSRYNAPIHYNYYNGPAIETQVSVTFSAYDPASMQATVPIGINVVPEAYNAALAARPDTASEKWVPQMSATMTFDMTGGWPLEFTVFDQYFVGKRQHVITHKFVQRQPAAAE